MSWYHYLLILLIIVGIVGNSLVIYIQSRLGGARVGSATATNRLVIGLAVADLLTAIFIIPLPEFVNVPQSAAGEFYCRVIQPMFMTWVAFMASVYTLTTISIERYLAIVHPFTYKVWVHNHRVKYAFVAIWLCAVIINLFIVSFHTVDECGECTSDFPSTASRKANGVFVFLIEYLGPLCVMAYANIKSMVVLRQDDLSVDKNGKPSDSDKSKQIALLRRRFASMFAVIFATFMVLWTPDQLCYLLYNLGVLPASFPSSVVYRLFVKVALLNATLANPIIYSVWLPQFRQASIDLLLCRGIGKPSEVRTHVSDEESKDESFNP